MKKAFVLSCLVFLMLGLAGCDDPIEDTVPTSFLRTQANPDDIYLYNSGDPIGVRLDPLVNDSIKVDVGVSYSVPEHGSITFIKDEGWFYKPEANYFGLDHITYTLCYSDKCISAPIVMHVEMPPDLANCTFEIIGEVS